MTHDLVNSTERATPDRWRRHRGDPARDDDTAGTGHLQPVTVWRRLAPRWRGGHREVDDASRTPPNLRAVTDIPLIDHLAHHTTRIISVVSEALVEGSWPSQATNGEPGTDGRGSRLW